MVQGRTVGWRQTQTVVFVVLGLSLLYAVVRYNVVRSVPWQHLPLLIANKAVALSGTILIGLSFLLGPLVRFWPKRFLPHLYLRKHFGISGFALAALHAIMSIVLLSPANYPKFFLPDGRLNFIGETSMLFGILAFLVFSAISVTSLPPVEKHMHPEQWKRVQRFGYAAYLFVLAHVVTMGFQGWWKPESWKFGLLSISLLSALAIIFVFVMRILVVVAPPRKQQ